MGYVPAPTRPDPGRPYDPPPNFGSQWIKGGPPKTVAPATPYRRYVWDLYGAQGRDWFPLLNAAAIGCLMALPAVIAYLMLG